MGSTHNASSCDESRCVSLGGLVYNRPWRVIESGPDFFSCWGGDGAYYPKMCADGFLPVDVVDQPVKNATHPLHKGNVTLSYFTCCPPNEASKITDATRHCSDPIVLDDASDAGNSSTCDAKNSTKKYAFPMEPLGSAYAYVCCDAVPTSNGTSFINVTDCVPYRNEQFDGYLRENDVGAIVPITCNFNGTFTHPKSSPTNRYQCCRQGPDIPPFVQDAAFDTTIYPLLILFTVAAMVSLIVVIGLLTPLLLQQMKGRNERHHTQSFSTYNMFLVYLSLFDLTFSFFQIAKYSSCIDQEFHPMLVGGVIRPPSFFPFKSFLNGYTQDDTVFLLPYSLGNLWINAIICYHILNLLKCSKNAQRVKPPSLLAANLQGGAVCLAAVTYGLILYFVTNAKINQIEKTSNRYGDYVDRVNTQMVATWSSFALLGFTPLIYVIYVTILTWCRGYMPSLHRSAPTSSNVAAAREQATRELAIFFYRIIGIFFVIWIPEFLISLITTLTTFAAPWRNMTIMCMYAIQPTLTFCLLMTKTDVRKYIMDLVTLSYFKKEKKPSLPSQNNAITTDTS